MQETILRKAAFNLIGISIRTGYDVEFNQKKGLISSCVQKYFHQGLFNKIPHRKNPGTTICAYTDYESDYKGAYTYFIGEEVKALPEKLPEGFEVLSIPGQIYKKFTTPPGPMPEVIIDGWKAIWALSPEQIGGRRRYHIDFELYDDRANDHNKVVADIYIGIAN